MVRQVWEGGGVEGPPGLTRGAADVDPQSQAAVAVVMGGRGYRETEKTGKASASCRPPPPHVRRGNRAESEQLPVLSGTS